MLRTLKRSEWIALSWIFVFFVAVGPSASAVPLETAHVTVVVKDVKLLASRATARAASVNDAVTTGTAVWTGSDSRAELTFTDLTITRLGANTVFSFNAGTRNLDLGNGAVLVQVPKGAPALHISTAAVTAAVTGGTALFESHAHALTKLMILEGTGQLCSKTHPDECATAHGGEMTMMSADGHITKPFKFDAALVLKTSKLIKGFPPLQNSDLISAVVEQQQAALMGESSSTTSNPAARDTVDVISTSVSASSASSTTSPPSKFGPPSAITSPDPYVITSGTDINTDPTITTNGVTNFGKIYRGLTQDGPLATWLGSSPSSFDTAFDSNFEPDPDKLPAAGFLFSSLRLDGDPMISNPNGVQILAFVSQNGITSNPTGAVFTFAGVERVALVALNGSIDLSGISFANFGELFIYARGASSNLTLAAPISNLVKVRANAEGSVYINAPISADDFKSRSGDFFQTGTTINANQIEIDSLGSIQISSSAQLLAMLNSVQNDGQVIILATGSNGSVDVSGQIQAEQGTVDIRETGDNGVININGATLHGDVVKIGALGANGVLNIGTGNGLSADTEIDLYAGGSNGTLNFLSNVTLSSPRNVLAANTINIAVGVVVTINSAQAADVFTNNPHYFGFGGTGNSENSGTFGGAGAKNPLPLSQAPGF